MQKKKLTNYNIIILRFVFRKHVHHHFDSWLSGEKLIVRFETSILIPRIYSSEIITSGPEIMKDLVFFEYLWQFSLF